jgi:hypothetical protein
MQFEIVRFILKNTLVLLLDVLKLRLIQVLYNSYTLICNVFSLSYIITWLPAYLYLISISYF